MRRAMSNRLPDSVRWRRGKEHLGWKFHSRVSARWHDDMHALIQAKKKSLGRYVKTDVLHRALFEQKGSSDIEILRECAALASWLERYE